MAVEQAQLAKYDVAIQLYAITFEDEDEKNSFVIKMAMVCEALLAIEPSWRVVDTSVTKSPG
jgi:hypothetical protein